MKGAEHSPTAMGVNCSDKCPPSMQPPMPMFEEEDSSSNPTCFGSGASPASFEKRPEDHGSAAQAQAWTVASERPSLVCRFSWFRLLRLDQSRRCDSPGAAYCVAGVAPAAPRLRAIDLSMCM